MNTMTVRSIRRVGSQRFEYDYAVEGEWTRCFDPAQPMWVEYSLPVAHVPDSVAVLPLIGNVIVLASLMDADIYVEEIDRDFLQCIEEFIDGFDTVMPEHVHFKHEDIVHAKRVVDTPLADKDREGNLLFFSGGVDATFSLISHLEEKPALVTVWGADIPWHNEEGWKQALGFNQEVADRYGLPLLSIRSNIRFSLNNDYLEDYSMKLVGDWWWPAFHSSVTMMCLAAPLACGRRQKLYFGSSYSAKDSKDWGRYVIASDPLIDNHVRFCGCQVVHDGYDYSRMDKVRAICAYYAPQKVKPFLRVCYHANTGLNCCRCEKCCRAIMSILLAGSDPCDYGFPYDKHEFPRRFAAGIQEIGRSLRYDFMSFYTDIHAAFRSQYSIDQVPRELRAFYLMDMETLADFLHVPNNERDAAVQSARERQLALLKQIDELRCCPQTDQPLDSHQALTAENHRLKEQIAAMENSSSWKVTSPLRRAGKLLRRIKSQPADM
ncbi:MAG: hypothetical protein ACI4O7_06840 [Aristaeellaceae bacterium]